MIVYSPSLPRPAGGVLDIEVLGDAAKYGRFRWANLSSRSGRAAEI